jgi:hypothetical protein
MARKTTARRAPRIRNLEPGRRATGAAKGGIVIEWTTSSSRPLSPAITRGFDPQPDPPAQG